MPPCPRSHDFRLSPDYEVLVDIRGPGEWIVTVDRRERPLHVYRLGRADWLVSEVGRENEGRGHDLTQALIALSAGEAPADWCQVIADALDAGRKQS